MGDVRKWPFITSLAVFPPDPFNRKTWRIRWLLSQVIA